MIPAKRTKLSNGGGTAAGGPKANNVLGHLAELNEAAAAAAAPGKNGKRNGLSAQNHPATTTKAGGCAVGPPRDFVVLSTFTFKHGVSKTKCRASSMKELETILRKALRLPADTHEVKYVNEHGILANLDQVDFLTLGVEPQFHFSPVKKRTRVAVLGGSFDPITDGHLKMACEIINSRCADEVWIVPCGPRPDKPSLRTPVFQRYIMCHLAVNTTFGARYPVKVCDFEVHQPKALATYHLMDKLKRQSPEHDFYFVIGTDLVESIHEWPAEGVPDAGEKLVAENNFLVVNRPGFEYSGELPPNFTRLEPAKGDNITLVGEELSSSEVRARLTPRPRPGPPSTLRRKSGFSNGDEEREAILGGDFMRAEGLVPSAVLAHIIRYNLYQHTEQHPSVDNTTGHGTRTTIPDLF